MPLYSKWTGAHWRLVSLFELGIPPTNRAARAAANSVLDWIAAPSRPISRGWRRPGAPSHLDAVDWGDAHQIVTPIARALLREGSA